MSKFVSREQVEVAAEAVRRRTTQSPSVGFILGSGSSRLANEISNPDIIPVDKIPNWLLPTVAGHTGRIII